VARVIRGVVRHRRQPGTRVGPARQAIRCFCLECVGYLARDVASCADTQCHLWPYRFGTHSPSPDRVVLAETSGAQRS